MSHIISVKFNNQQRELLERLQLAEFGTVDLPTLVRHAIEQAPAHIPAPARSAVPAPPARKVLSEHLIEPGKGVAIEVRKGQVLRIEQVEGMQCGDFNIYNLHDRNEHLHSGRTMILHGFSPTKGDLLWSNGPRERPMMAILENTSRTDTLYAACSGVVYSRVFGARAHTNCQQIQAEAQREYGISAHHVHPSFNLFMYVEFDAEGQSYIVKNKATKEDYIEFAALMDVLAIPNVCGDDYGKSSNYWLRPLRAIVMEATEDDAASTARMTDEANSAVLEVEEQAPPIPLRKDVGYTPSFPHLPITEMTYEVELDDQQLSAFNAARNSDLYPDDVGASARDLVMEWVGTRIDW